MPPLGLLLGYVLTDGTDSIEILLNEEVHNRKADLMPH